MLLLYAFGGLVILGFFFGVSIYNRLINLRNQYKNAFSQIDVQLKRRYDLVPNLVETAKAYLKHEKETLEAVMQARNMAQTVNKRAAENPANAELMQSLLKSESQLQGALGRLFAVVESYPDLKADKTIRDLSEELSSTENKISFARQAYNDTVMFFNTKRETFPNVFVANMLNIQNAQLFEIENQEERKAPKVAFN